MLIGQKQIQGDLYDYIIADTIPQEYTIVTSVKKCLEIADLFNKDYKWKRRFLQEIDYNTTSDYEKEIISQFRANTEPQGQSVLGDSYQYWASQFGLLSKQCRQIRFENAKTILFRCVAEFPDRYIISAFLKNNPQLRQDYIEDGIEGTVETNPDPIEGIFNWIEATHETAYYDLIDNVKVVKPQFEEVGIVNDNNVIKDALGNTLGIFQTTGLAAMNLNMLNGVTKEQLIIDLMQCLRYGNY